jgi:hypothetical protein
MGADPNLSASVPAPISAISPAPGKAASIEPDGGRDASPSAAASADPNLSAFVADDLRVSFDTDPADRRIDRLFACLGLLDDAAPMFRPGRRVPGACVLLALPALLDSGVLECARDAYGSLAPAFYGLRRASWRCS